MNRQVIVAASFLTLSVLPLAAADSIWIEQSVDLGGPGVRVVLFFDPADPFYPIVMGGGGHPAAFVRYHINFRETSCVGAFALENSVVVCHPVPPWDG